MGTARAVSTPIVEAVLAISKGRINTVAHDGQLMEAVGNHSLQDPSFPPLNSEADFETSAKQLRMLLGVRPPPPPPSSISAPDAKHLLDASSIVRTEDARPVDPNEDSTVAGSVASNSERSDIGDSDGERHVAWSADVQPSSFAMLWLGPDRPDPCNVPMTKLVWQ